ncbi:MAG TPA: polysaccharide deacetylase family protein [Candidatus Marinimicrobia bacterium]|nr:polysaccharide deacetylase family protein [Candidatus Neomarinimicrobiota bacterium]HRU93375.1 polysaccharide deacetylase family protein [Candidatus Neomarinimicrobiota bacterium]
MLKFKQIGIITVLILINTVHAGEINPSYEVGVWQGFRSAAVTFTFDDGCANQFTVAIPLFDQHGFKLTLYPVINWSGGIWSKLQSAAANGHEVGSHTVTHPDLSGLSEAEQITELQNSQNEINSRISGQRCITIAYPYCNAGKTSICKQYYIAARGCSGQIEPKTPSNFMNISSIVCGTEGSVKTANDFFNKAKSAANSKGWVVFLIHGIDNDGGWSPVTTENLTGAVDSLSAYPDKFWVSSFANVARYIQERNNVSITETAVTDSSITFQVSDTLDNGIYNIPLTIRRVLPEGWSSAEISQNSEKINSKIVEIGTTKYLMFNVIPDEGDIILVKNVANAIQLKDEELPTTPYLKQNYPNPFNPKTTIAYSISQKSFVTLRVYNLFGQEVVTLVNEDKIPGEYTVEFDGSYLPSGTYFYKICAGDFSSTKKLILLK